MTAAPWSRVWAERWEISPDGLVYTFHLRPGSHWSNGAPLTSEDFLFSFRRIMDPLVACEESSFGFAIRGAEDFALGRTRTLGLGARRRPIRDLRHPAAHPAPYFLGTLAVGSPFFPVYGPCSERFGGVHQRGTPWTREGNLIPERPFVLAR